MIGVRRSIFFSAADKYLSQFLLIMTTMVMARILTPAETGLYMTANAVIMLADNFRNFGVSVYIVQERDLSRALIRSAFTVNLVLSVTIGTAIYFGAGSVAAFYESPELKTLLLVSVIGFIAIPFSSPIMALLQRDMAFMSVACINITAALMGATVTITLGLSGFGPVSYIWGFVAASFTIAVLAVGTCREFWIFRPSLASARRLLSFGIVSSLITVSNMAYELLPRLAFGKILGFDAVGLYSRAVTVCQLPDRFILSGLQPVILPAFAAHARSGGSLKESYLRGFAMMSAVQWPVLIMLSLLANPFVFILLGPQWGQVPPLVRVMALANMALVPAMLTFPVLVSAGRIKDALWASLVSLPPSAAITIGAAFFGLNAVAASLLIVAPLQMLVAYYFIRNAIGLTGMEFLQAGRNSFFFALGTALVPVLVLATSPRGFDFGPAQTLVAITGGAAGWLAVLALVDHPLKQEIAVLRLSLAQNIPFLRPAPRSR